MIMLNGQDLKTIAMQRINSSYLEGQQLKFKDMIESIAHKAHPNVGAIWDGVADVKAYCDSTPRVAWILKEAYDKDAEGNVGGGGWSHPEFLDGLSINDIMSKPTWRRVNWIMYAIRNRIKHYDSSLIVQDNYLKDIVWLNLSKTPGASISDGSFKHVFADNWSKILKGQVDAYNPEIIILGNTFDDCKQTLFPDCTLIQKGKYVHIYSSGERLLIYAYHPGARITNENYINPILDAVNSYSSK